jgi:hypothetical protein
MNTAYGLVFKTLHFLLNLQNGPKKLECLFVHGKLLQPSAMYNFSLLDH